MRILFAVMWLLAFGCPMLLGKVKGQGSRLTTAMATTTLRKFVVQPNPSDTMNPRMAAFEKAIQNARALVKVGAYDLATVEYDRAIRLNTNSAHEILNEKKELLLSQRGTGLANSDESEEVPILGSPRSRNDSVASPKPFVADSIQTRAIPYSPVQLAEMFPGIDFTQMPPGQILNMTDEQGKHAVAIERTRKMKPLLQLSDSAGNIIVTCERVYFSGLNTYLKIGIRNHSASDFPVGSMLLSWKQGDKHLLGRVPVAVSDYPVVQPGKSFSLIYVCRSMYMRNDEELYFSLQERLGYFKWQLVIPGRVYNQERNKSANYW